MPAATKGATPTKPLLIAGALILVGILIGAFVYGRSRTDGEGTTTGNEASAGEETNAATENPPGGDFQGQLLVGTTNLFTESGQIADLSQFVNQEVRGQRIAIQEIVSDTVVWIGNSERARVLVTLPPTDQNVTNGENIAVGSIVELSGVIRELRDDRGNFGIGDEEGQALLTQQGAYIEATNFVAYGQDAPPSDSDTEQGGDTQEVPVPGAPRGTPGAGND